MQIINNVEQRTEAWMRLRSGRLTASNAHIIYTGGKGLETLCYELIADYYSNTEKENITNADIERGVELEEVARSIYEANTGFEVTQICFAIYNDYIGASPDGIVLTDKWNTNNDLLEFKIDRLLEIKCPSDKVYIKVLLEDYIDPKYYAQMQMQMFILEANKCDYVCYNPHFKQDIKIITVNRDDIFIEKLKKGLTKGESILKELHKKMKGIE